MLGLCLCVNYAYSYGRACAADCAGLRLRGCVAGARLTAVWTVRMSDSKNCIYSNMLYFPGYDL